MLENTYRTLANKACLENVDFYLLNNPISRISIPQKIIAALWQGHLFLRTEVLRSKFYFRSSGFVGMIYYRKERALMNCFQPCLQIVTRMRFAVQEIRFIGKSYFKGSRILEFGVTKMLSVKIG